MSEISLTSPVKNCVLQICPSMAIIPIQLQQSVLGKTGQLGIRRQHCGLVEKTVDWDWEVLGFIPGFATGFLQVTLAKSFLSLWPSLSHLHNWKDDVSLSDVPMKKAKYNHHFLAFALYWRQVTYLPYTQTLHLLHRMNATSTAFYSLFSSLYSSSLSCTYYPTLHFHLPSLNS